MTDSSSMIVVVGSVVAAVPMVIGFLLARLINGVDKKLDDLTQGHTTVLIQLAQLEVRINALERWDRK